MPLMPKFVQAKSFYRGGNAPTIIVIHDMEYPEKPGGAEWCADFFASGRVQASAHYCVDNDSVVQCVKDTDGAWHTPGSLPKKGGREINRSSIGIEHAGYAKQTAEEWLDDYSRAMLELSAELTATLCVRFSIPAVKLTPQDLIDGKRGICGHVDCTKATGVGSHWDPGPGFPWEWYLARVGAHVKLLSASISEVIVVDGEPVELGDWPIVTADGVRYHVAPIYIAPIGIGQAQAMADELNCELPSIALVDAIWAAADVRIEPITRSTGNGLLTDWGASMSSLATFNDQAERIEKAIGGRPFKLLAGTHKDVVLSDAGVLGLYGWHRLNGTTIQPFYSKHARGHIDYSQGLRLVRRV